MSLVLSLHMWRHSSAQLLWSVTVDHKHQSSHHAHSAFETGEKGLQAVSLVAAEDKPPTSLGTIPKTELSPCGWDLTPWNSLSHQWVLFRACVLSHFVDFSKAPRWPGSGFPSYLGLPPWICIDPQGPPPQEHARAWGLGLGSWRNYACLGMTCPDDRGGIAL